MADLHETKDIKIYSKTKYQRILINLERRYENTDLIGKELAKAILRDLDDHAYNYVHFFIEPIKHKTKKYKISTIQHVIDEGLTTGIKFGIDMKPYNIIMQNNENFIYIHNNLVKEWKLKFKQHD